MRNEAIKSTDPWVIPGIKPKVEPQIIRIDRRINPSDILRVLEEHSDIKWAEVVSHARKRPIAQMRQVICYILYKQDKQYKMTLKEIGKLLGGRDHTTILTAIQTASNLHETNETTVVEFFKLFQSYL